MAKNGRLFLTEGSPNGMALVSKTSGSNPLQVRVLYPPQFISTSFCIHGII